MKLTEVEAKAHISRIAPRLGSDYTREPIFPSGRDDVAMVEHKAENGNDYGYDTIYLVWKVDDGRICHHEVVNSSATKDYITVYSITADGDEVTICHSQGGCYSTYRPDVAKCFNLKTKQTRDVTATDFTLKARDAMFKVRSDRAKHLPKKYRGAIIQEQEIDPKNKVAAFILYEQIDYAETRGAQLRYSVHKTTETDIESQQLYSDHSWELGVQGRDCSLKSLKLENGTVSVETAAGERLVFT